VSTTETTLSTGADLAAIRERKPLVHQITNYVVMNETANATLALGALPVMAHAREEVEEMAAAAGALVLNIGTLSPPWVEAMLAAGGAANAAGVPIVVDPVGAGATRYRTETARRLLAELEVAVVRGNAAEVATLAGREAEIRGVESIGAGDSAGELARAAANELGAVAAVTGAVDHVSDGDRSLAVSNGDPLLVTITGSGCMATAITGCFLAVRPDDPLAAAAEALVAFGVAGEEAAREAKGPGSFHASLYDALAALEPARLDARAQVG
jgi:hydroxyethylthiazole kinase